MVVGVEYYYTRRKRLEFCLWNLIRVYHKEINKTIQQSFKNSVHKINQSSKSPGISTVTTSRSDFSDMALFLALPMFLGYWLTPTNLRLHFKNFHWLYRSRELIYATNIFIIYGLNCLFFLGKSLYAYYRNNIFNQH